MIDIKELRIGSHVAICGGERVRVTAICSNGIVTTTLGDMDEKNLTPISITPELLKELGFEDCSKKRWHREDWEKRNGDKYISFSAFDNNLHHERWRIQYYVNVCKGGNCIVRYLHEAEAFLALHNIELIKE